MEREWWVFSTAVEEVCLLVQCGLTGKYGKVADPSKDEWDEAFHAPSNPIRWYQDWRVEELA